MKYVDQSATGLRYFLIAEGVDVTPFEVIDTASFRWDHRRIEMGILGASHYLRIDWGDGQVLTELFACADPQLDVAFVKSAPFKDLPVRQEVDFADNLYRFVPRLVSWNEGKDELAELVQAIVGATPERRQWGLTHQFPSLPGGDETKPPLTLVYARVGGTFTLKTAHCYPNEDQIVFSTTTISKRR
jgi:hypothetical protein